MSARARLREPHCGGRFADAEADGSPGILHRRKKLNPRSGVLDVFLSKRTSTDGQVDGLQTSVAHEGDELLRVQPREPESVGGREQAIQRYLSSCGSSAPRSSDTWLGDVTHKFTDLPRREPSAVGFHNGRVADGAADIVVGPRSLVLRLGFSQTTTRILDVTGCLWASHDTSV